MAQSISFKQWNEQPTFTDNFKMISKYTDLGSPDGRKSLLGIVLNMSINTPSDAESPSLFSFDISYRTGPDGSFIYLDDINNYTNSSFDGDGNIEVLHLFVTPVQDILNIQLKIEGSLVNDIGINDFGLIFRTYRDSNVVSLDD
jgi:hypothetical protein